jgi:ubiquinone/menaquinone biosynthesis C-methylase UbiE
MDSEKVKYDKTQEKLYVYWNELFDTHGGYMLPAGTNEYAILRDLLLAFIRDGESVLDLGCASGGTYDWILDRERDVEYKGTDFADKFVKANQERHPDILWEVEDCRELNEEDGSFDVVILYDVLDGLVGWEQALDEAYRVARKRVLVMMWCDPAMDDKRAYMEKFGTVTDIKVEGNVHFHRLLVGLK